MHNSGSKNRLKASPRNFWLLRGDLVSGDARLEVFMIRHALGINFPILDGVLALACNENSRQTGVGKRNWTIVLAHLDALIGGQSSEASAYQLSGGARGWTPDSLHRKG